MAYSAPQSITEKGREYITTKLASTLTSYTSDYVGQLARDGYIESLKKGKERYVEKAGFLHYALEAGKVKENIFVSPKEYCPLINDNEDNTILNSDAESIVDPSTPLEFDPTLNAHVLPSFRGNYISRSAGNFSRQSYFKASQDETAFDLFPGLISKTDSREELATLEINSSLQVKEDNQDLMVRPDFFLDRQHKYEITKDAQQSDILIAEQYEIAEKIPSSIIPAVKKSVGGEVRRTVEALRTTLLPQELNDIHIAPLVNKDDNDLTVKERTVSREIHKDAILSVDDNSSDRSDIDSSPNQDDDFSSKRSGQSNLIVYQQRAVALPSQVISFIQRQSPLVKALGLVVPVSALALVLTSFNVFDKLQHTLPVEHSAQIARSSKAQEIIVDGVTLINFSLKKAGGAIELLIQR